MLAKRLTAAFIASLGWTALALQFCINVAKAIADESSVAGYIVTYLSFFTVLTNLCVAACLALAAYEPDEENFWNWPAVQTALGLYILVVAIVYAAVLQGLWTPQGLEYVTERIFHVVIPVLYITYWTVFTPKGSLRFSDQLFWLGFPFLYLVYILTRGAMIGSYPYPFLDVLQDGYQGVLLNSAMILGLFCTLGSCLILIDWLLANRQGASDSSRDKTTVTMP